MRTNPGMDSATAAAAAADARGTVVDVTLFKATGLYEMLSPPPPPPQTTTTTGPRRSPAAVRALCCLVGGLHAVLFARLLRRPGDLSPISVESMVLVNGLLSVVKGLALTGDGAGRLLAALDAAGFGFTACGLRRPARLLRCRSIARALLRAYVLATYFASVTWVLAPWMLGSAVGSVDWAVGYAAEVASVLVVAVCGVAFDCYLITACLALRAQFHTAAEACAAVGHRRPPPSDVGALRYSAVTSGGNRMNASRKRLDDDYDELLRYVVDMQKIMKKLNDLYDIVGPVVQIQMASGCFSISILVFFILNTCLKSAMVLKLIIGLTVIISQLYMYCHTLSLLETAKSALNFGLYSSNWTEMDLKFRKTILLTMNLNSVQTKNIKIAPRLIVNLELFSKVMVFSYRIVSVFIEK